MYNTMYGSGQTQTIAGKAGPIHIKIEDQTGINVGSKYQQANNQHPNTIPSTTTKKQFQQTAQKFGNAIKAQHNVQNNVNLMNKSGAKTSFARKKSKAGLNPISNNNSTVQTVVQSGNTTSKNG